MVASRISGVPGVELVGPIPQALQTWIGFTAGVDERRQGTRGSARADPFLHRAGSRARPQGDGHRAVRRVIRGLRYLSLPLVRIQAIADEVPQVLIMTGDPSSATRGEPLAARLRADLPERGRGVRRAARFHRAQTTRSRSCRRTTTTVRATSRASSGHRGRRQHRVVEELTYEATDTSVDAQLTELANASADVFFNAMSVTPLVILALEKAQQLGWTPAGSCRRTRRAPRRSSSPAAARRSPASTPFVLQGAAEPRFAQDPDVVEYLAALKEYGDYPDPPAFPHCQWSWMVGRRSSRRSRRCPSRPVTTSWRRCARSRASRRRSCCRTPSVTTTEDGQPAVSTVVVQKYNGRGYDTVETFE